MNKFLIKEVNLTLLCISFLDLAALTTTLLKNQASQDSPNNMESQWYFLIQAPEIQELLTFHKIGRQEIQPHTTLILLQTSVNNIFKCLLI